MRPNGVGRQDLSSHALRRQNPPAEACANGRRGGHVVGWTAAAASFSTAEDDSETIAARSVLNEKPAIAKNNRFALSSGHGTRRDTGVVAFECTGARIANENQVSGHGRSRDVFLCTERVGPKRVHDE